MEDDLIYLLLLYQQLLQKKLLVNLHRKLSISVPRCPENPVGNVIFGKKLCSSMESKYSVILGLLFIFSKSIL